MNPHQVLTIFERQQIIDKALSQKISHTLTNENKSLPDALKDFGVIKHSNDLWQVIASELELEAVDLSSFNPSPTLLATLPFGLVKSHQAFPVHLQNNLLTIALVDPLDIQKIELLQFGSNYELQLVIAPAEQIKSLINEYYGDQKLLINDIIATLDKETPPTKNSEQNSPVLKYVNYILEQTIQEKASDIHFEPFDTNLTIRYRLDGRFITLPPLPTLLAPAITSCLKAMAGMDITEKRVPQDGRITKRVTNHLVDIRISSLPTQHGESVVCRILDQEKVSLSLQNLGLPNYLVSKLKKLIHKPNGIFLVTGPTGAGKTTTLYAALQDLNNVETKILTVEDPIEYNIDGIIQVASNERIGLSFSKVLRSFLRQDPDKILIGEIRDHETAEIAIQSALTGHMVLSTLHTSSATGAITRLQDLGVTPFFITSTLQGVLAQRLVQKVCSHCKTQYTPEPHLIELLNLPEKELNNKQFYKGLGCKSCDHTGYKGRLGIFELLTLTDSLKDLITQQTPESELRKKAKEQGLLSLREEGLRNVFNGSTTIEEVLQHT